MLGFPSLSWMATRLNGLLATALVRPCRFIGSPWSRTARSSIEPSTAPLACPGGCTSPTQFLGRIAALIPPPRSHLLRYHGVFAPHSKHRARIVPQCPRATPASATTAPHRPSRSRSRLDWASLLRRVFALDVLHCERCGGRRHLLSVITEAKTTQKILAHLGLQTKAPAQSPARAPPLIPDSVDWSDQAGVDPIPSSWSS